MRFYTINQRSFAFEGKIPSSTHKENGSLQVLLADESWAKKNIDL